MRKAKAKGRSTARTVLAAATAVGMCGVLSAHQDDPKANSLIPKYEGPGFRRALAGPMALGGGFASEGVTLRSWLPINEFAGSHDNANDVWGHTSASGREYAILGLECGNGFVEITDPDDAQIVATIAGPCSLWGDIKSFGDYVYAVTESPEVGIQVIDVSDIDNGNVTLVNEIELAGTGRTHNVVVDTVSGFLYRVGGYHNGFGAYDLNADPVAPPLVGSWSDRYIHDAQVVTYTEGPFAGRQIMFAASGDNGGWENGRLEILDVTDKSAAFTVSEIFYQDTMYSHQVWVSEDLRYAYLNDELDERELGLDTATRIFDVSDIESPSFVGTFGNGLAVIDHNLYVVGDLIFEANYTSGLRVFDRSDPEAPVEVAWFDTRPEGDETDFYALWGNYPFFPSRTVVGSDEQRGLFVWTIDLLDVCLGDLDGNGLVGFADLVQLLSVWGPCDGCPEDLDGDDNVGFPDVVLLLSVWGPCE